MLVCAEALGPVRCDGFDARRRAGRRAGHLSLHPLPGDRGRAGRQHVRQRPLHARRGQAADEFAVDVGLTRTFIKEPGGGEIVRRRRVGVEGRRQGVVRVADETHLYVSRELRPCTGRSRVTRASASSPSRGCTTRRRCSQPGEHSIAEQAAERYRGMPAERRCCARRAVRPPSRATSRSASATTGRSSRRCAPATARPLSGSTSTGSSRSSATPRTPRARLPLLAQHPRASRRPRGWRRTRSPPCSTQTSSPSRAPRSTLGFDGSENDDHTALWLCTEDGDLVPVGIWTPDGEDLAWREDVHAAVDWCFDTFEIVRFERRPAVLAARGGVWASRHSNPRTPSTLPGRGVLDEPGREDGGGVRRASHRDPPEGDPHPAGAAAY
jgi:hypothetical protein